MQMGKMVAAMVDDKKRTLKEIAIHYPKPDPTKWESKSPAEILEDIQRCYDDMMKTTVRRFVPHVTLPCTIYWWNKVLEYENMTGIKLDVHWTVPDVIVPLIDPKPTV
jgi:hypothetical protein